MEKHRLYITKKNQIWTIGGTKDVLTSYLDGEDDEILQFAVPDKDFAIILKNDMTYTVLDTQQEAKDYIANIYRNYNIYQNNDDRCYIMRDDHDRRYLTSAEAQKDGVFDYVFVPKGKYYITKFGKIIGVGSSEQEMQQKMYEHYRAKYTYSA